MITTAQMNTNCTHKNDLFYTKPSCTTLPLPSICLHLIINQTHSCLVLTQCDVSFFSVSCLVLFLYHVCFFSCFLSCVLSGSFLIKIIIHTWTTVTNNPGQYDCVRATFPFQFLFCNFFIMKNQIYMGHNVSVMHNTDIVPYMNFIFHNECIKSLNLEKECGHNT